MPGCLCGVRAEGEARARGVLRTDEPDFERRLCRDAEGRAKERLRTPLRRGTADSPGGRIDVRARAGAQREVAPARQALTDLEAERAALERRRGSAGFCGGLPWPATARSGSG